MAKARGTVEVQTEKCKGCDLCVKACPSNVLAMSKKINAKGYTYSYMEKPDECTGCMNCGLVCPDSVITVYKLN